MLRDPKPAARQNAAEAVLQAVGELKASLHDKEANVRYNAAFAFGKGGPEAVPQVVLQARRANAPLADDVAAPHIVQNTGSHPAALVQGPNSSEPKPMLR